YRTRALGRPRRWLAGCTRYKCSYPRLSRENLTNGTGVRARWESPRYFLFCVRTALRAVFAFTERGDFAARPAGLRGAWVRAAVRGAGTGGGGAGSFA